MSVFFPEWKSSKPKIKCLIFKYFGYGAVTLSLTTLSIIIEQCDTQHNPECCYVEHCYAECHYVECHYVECHYVECRYAECRGTLGNYNLQFSENF